MQSASKHRREMHSSGLLVREIRAAWRDRLTFETPYVNDPFALDVNKDFAQVQPPAYR